MAQTRKIEGNDGSHATRADNAQTLLTDDENVKAMLEIFTENDSPSMLA